MRQVRRIAIIGNSLPRRCGIATFTTDLYHAIEKAAPNAELTIVAMTDPGRSYEYPESVGFEIHDDVVENYERAAEFVNAGRFDVVSLQHEFGIFGGEAGEHIIALISRLSAPLVTTMHTVLAEPTEAQREVVNQIVASSAIIVVMAEKARELLQNIYHVPAGKIEVIAHGIPDFPFVEPDAAKAKMGFAGRPVLFLTFGLISPNKGIEVMIDAMPSILENTPNAVYIVLGATHPNLVRQEGEAYRERLVTRVRELGVEANVEFLNQFVDQATLLEFISMCDVYVTPYLNASQMTSGTLSYSFGLGKAVVSTPYWHAQELLADGRGFLVPFGDVAAIAGAISKLLTNDELRLAVRERAYASSRHMTWRRTADRYLTAFSSAARPRRPRVVAQAVQIIRPHRYAPLEMRMGYFQTMCDDTGLFQHADYCVPDRSHGYCVDDNARALLFACALDKPGEQRLSESRTASFSAFVQHAWNPDKKRFRNFMGFDRRWLEDEGSEDSHGRTLWALGECARGGAGDIHARWASALFARALPAVAKFTSPRAWAFTLLGLDAYCATFPADWQADEIRRDLAGRLMSLLLLSESRDWVWFEDGLAYDNARLCQALLATGRALKTASYVAAGLRSLHWLMAIQTAPSGVFRPVGSQTFGDKRRLPRPFDQQPIEASASISACLEAWRAGGEGKWRSEAARAFGWFFGANDLGVSLIDLETGACCDGLHPDRLNENRGGESVVSYLLSLVEMRQLARISGDQLKLASFEAAHA